MWWPTERATDATVRVALLWVATTLAVSCTDADTTRARAWTFAGDTATGPRSPDTATEDRTPGTPAVDTDPTSCDAAPACDADDEIVETCPDARSCYTGTACGKTVMCVRPDFPYDGYESGLERPSSDCPPPASKEEEEVCDAAEHCCVNEVTGEECAYADSCAVPDDPGDNWSCGLDEC